MQIETMTPEEFFGLSTIDQYKLIKSSSAHGIMTLLWTLEGERKSLYDAIDCIQKS